MNMTVMLLIVCTTPPCLVKPRHILQRKREIHTHTTCANKRHSIRCTDYYPYMEPWNQFPFANRLNVNTGGRGVQSLDNYLDNLLILRTAALRHNLTFWNYFGAAAFQVCLPSIQFSTFFVHN